MIGRLLLSTPRPSPNVKQNLSVYAPNGCVISQHWTGGKGGTKKIWSKGKPSFLRIRMNCFKAEQPTQLLLSGIVDIDRATTYVRRVRRKYKQFSRPIRHSPSHLDFLGWGSVSYGSIYFPQIKLLLYVFFFIDLWWFTVLNYSSDLDLALDFSMVWHRKRRLEDSRVLWEVRAF